MTERDFLYWLQGAIELGNLDSINAKERATIRAHAELVLENDEGSPLANWVVGLLASEPPSGEACKIIRERIATELENVTDARTTEPWVPEPLPYLPESFPPPWSRPTVRPYTTDRTAKILMPFDFDSGIPESQPVVISDSGPRIC